MTVALMLMSAGSALAQIKSEIEVTRAQIQADRQAIVADAMTLTDGEAEVFWPLYREYRGEMAKVGDDLIKVITSYADKYQTLTDFEASTLLKDYMGVEKRTLKVHEKFLPKFNKILPAVKVLRFFQIENKLNTIIMMDLVLEIPLAE
jgi:hypothetical protein